MRKYLQQDVIPKVQADLVLKRIEKDVEYISMLSEDLLDVNRINVVRPEEEPDYTLVSIFELLNNILSDISEVTYQKKLCIKLEAQFFSELLVKGSYKRLHQAFTNLISNAVKYSTENGEILIRIKYIKENQLQVIIKDNGLGIPKNELEKIATPYYRASNVNKVKGTGLGLVITKKIIESHNGTFKIYSEGLGKGTEVIITLPLVKAKKKNNNKIK